MSDSARTFPLPKHWRKINQGKYLGEWNLFNDATGRHVVVDVTIADVTHEEVIGEGGRKDKCLVLRFTRTFEGQNLPFIVTTKNGKMLASQFGSLDPSTWRGKSFKLGVELTKTRNGMAHVMRVQAASARTQELKAMLAPDGREPGQEG